jgi:hypothetical protein
MSDATPLVRLPVNRTREGRIALLDSFGACLYAVLTQDGLIKIGWSEEVGERITRIGGVLNLLAIRFGATREDENEIHRRLDGHAVKGREWYADTPAVREVVNAMRAEMGMPPLDAREGSA